MYEIEERGMGWERIARQTSLTLIGTWRDVDGSRERRLVIRRAWARAVLHEGSVVCEYAATGRGALSGFVAASTPFVKPWQHRLTKVPSRVTTHRT